MTLLVSLVFYATLVLVSYRTRGLQPLPRVKFRDPIRSAERLALWSGVRLLALLARVARSVYGLLSEASADVGDWYLSRRHTFASRGGE